MAALRPWTVLTGVFIFYLLGHLYCEGQKEVKVRRGEDATLECYGPSGATDILFRWTKDEQQIEGYVIYFKDGRFEKHNQNDLFKGRVEMKDSKWMKNGNFSVILQNVTMNDSGTYECEAGYSKQAPRLLNSTSLKVEEPGQAGGQSGDGDGHGGKKDEGDKSGSVGLIVGLSVSAVLLVVAVGFVIYRNYRKSKYQSPSEQGQQMEMS